MFVLFLKKRHFNNLLVDVFAKSSERQPNWLFRCFGFLFKRFRYLQNSVQSFLCEDTFRQPDDFSLNRNQCVQQKVASSPLVLYRGWCVFGN